MALPSYASSITPLLRSRWHELSPGGRVIPAICFASLRGSQGLCPYYVTLMSTIVELVRLRLWPGLYRLSVLCLFALLVDFVHIMSL